MRRIIPLSVRITAYSAGKSLTKALVLQRSSGTRVGPVDDAEIAKFSQMAHSWWDANGEMAPLHDMNPLRVNYIRQKIAAHLPAANRTSSPHYSPLRGLNIADVGCGAGLLSESLARLGARVVGVDAAAQNITMATLHAEQHAKSFSGRSVYAPLTVLEGEPTAELSTVDHSLQYTHSTAEQLVERGLARKFDAVCALEIIEHVPHPRDFVATCASLVKPGGLLFMSTINRTTKSWMLSIVGAEYVLRLVPPGTHDWNKFVTPDELKSYFAAAATPSSPAPPQPAVDGQQPPQQQAVTALPSTITPQDTRGMMYNPLTRRWSFIHDVDVNYITYATVQAAEP